jgi:riboflavin synthase
MFTGIIESLGKFRRLFRHYDQWRLEIDATHFKNIEISQSISVNGVCLTVISAKEKSLVFDILNETYEKTNFSLLKPNDFLNLERSLKVGSELGGHFVTGHVDGTGKILEIVNKGEERIFSIEAPGDLVPYLACKGSIAVEGVSLTLGKISNNIFEVYLVPYTLSHTNLGTKNEGDWINIEIDILARYALSSRLEKKSKISLEFLREHGF